MREKSRMLSAAIDGLAFLVDGGYVRQSAAAPGTPESAP